MERIYVSVREACSVLGSGRSTVYRLIASEQLQSVKIGRRRLIKRQALVALGEKGTIVVAAKNKGSKAANPAPEHERQQGERIRERGMG